jgi:acetyl esterase/lipase
LDVGSPITRREALRRATALGFVPPFVRLSRTDVAEAALVARRVYFDNPDYQTVQAQGMQDVRVVPAESEQMVRALKEKGVAVTYITFRDEGHGFVRPENRLAFNAVVEAFLAKHLGGRYQPIGDDFTGSTIKIETGGELVPGRAG